MGILRARALYLSLKALILQKTRISGTSLHSVQSPSQVFQVWPFYLLESNKFHSPLSPHYLTPRILTLPEQLPGYFSREPAGTFSLRPVPGWKGRPAVEFFYLSLFLSVIRHGELWAAWHQRHKFRSSPDSPHSGPGISLPMPLQACGQVRKRKLDEGLYPELM